MVLHVLQIPNTAQLLLKFRLVRRFHVLEVLTELQILNIISNYMYFG